MDSTSEVTVLLVEDSEVDAKLVLGLLQRVGGQQFSVTHVTSLADAQENLRQADGNMDVVLLDLNLPDSTGLATLRQVVAGGARVPIVVLTGSDETVGMQAMREGAQDYLPKGQIQGPLLARSLRYALERHRSSVALRTSNESLSRVISSATDAIITKDMNGVITSWNPAAERLYGYPAGEALGKSMLMLFPADRIKEEREILERIAKGERVSHYESVRVRKDGRPVQVSLTISPIRDNGGHITGASNIARDISMQKESEERLRRQASLLDQTYDAILAWDWEGPITYWNQAAEKMYGYLKDEALGKVSHALLQSSTRGGVEELLATLKKEGHWEGELEHIRRDGKHILVESRMVLVNGERRYVLETNREISERRLLEEQLRQSQKMEGIGRLAGGVAHDFNNLLGVILACAELLADTTDISKVKPRAEEIRKAGERAANLTRQLLAFSRKQILEPKVLDLNFILTDMSKMLLRLVGEDVQFKTVLQADLGKVRLDPGQVEQILLNLVVNARDAMPKGGRITLETQNVELDSGYGQEHAAVTPGPYVMIVLSDSGAGMDAETQTHIFEPFFTTKQGGTGLGLATVYGAVKQSGGHIWVYSELGKGTTFKLYFPRVDVEPSRNREEIAVEIPQGTATVLLVEDFDALRELTVEFLQIAGYTVIAANCGKDALALAEQYKEPIHLLLTDVVMPKMSGAELSKKIKKIHPETRTLFMSGYTSDAIVHHGVLNTGVTLLTKPFSRATLTRKVHEFLHNGTENTGG